MCAVVRRVRFPERARTGEKSWRARDSPHGESQRGPEHVTKAGEGLSAVARRSASPAGMAKVTLLEAQMPAVQSATNRRALDAVSGGARAVMVGMRTLLAVSVEE